MRLNITTVRNCDLLLVILVTVSPSKLENELKKHVRNVARITHGFVKVVVIFFFFTFNTRWDYVVPSDLA